ncbi:MAG: bacteriohemerythrin [Thermodesulfovibrionales bacterium]
MRDLRGNRLFLTLLLAAFLFFVLVISYGGRLLYEKELKAQHARVASELQHGKEVIGYFLYDLFLDLQFLQDLPDIKGFGESGFRSAAYRDRAEGVLYGFVRSHYHISRLSIIDFSGRETVGRDGLQCPAPGGEPAPTLREDFVRQALRVLVGQKEQTFLSTGIIFHDGAPPRPLIHIAMPLPSARDGEEGLLVADVELMPLLALLPKGFVIHDSSGQETTRQPDGSFAFKKSPYGFGAPEGRLKISDREELHFSTLQLLGGGTWIIALKDSHRELRQSLLRMVLAALFLFLLFFCMMFIISFIMRRKLRELDASQKAIIFSLANLAEWRDPETGYHLERTRNYGVILTRQLLRNPRYRKTITGEFIQDLYAASPLHDIGKVGLPDSILLKEGKLTDREFAEMKNHVRIGMDILDELMSTFKISTSFLVMSRNITGYHHEKFDGSGYPEGLHGEAIPLEARIYALCDAYDAIRAKRPYKPPIPHDEAIRRIVSSGGTHFDPDIVEAFLRCEKEFMEAYETYDMLLERKSELAGLGSRLGSRLSSRKNLGIQWNESLSVGVAAIDFEHRELIDGIGALLRAIVQGKGKEEVSRTVQFLEEYVVMHFGREEKYMLEHEYPAYALHLARHREFIETFARIKQEYAARGASSEMVIELNRYIVEWLIHHISKEDKALGEFLLPRLTAEADDVQKSA